MYPPSPYANPVGSFQSPVPVVTVDPQQATLLYVGINPAWFPYIIGSLYQLLLQSTWDYSDLNELEVTQGRVWNLIDLFNISTAKTLDQLTGTIGVQWEENVTAQVRTTCIDGVFKFQVLKCACPETWVDISLGGLSSQGGPGSQQPQSGGGKATYDTCVPANSQYYIPTPLTTGDTVSFDNPSGAWNDPDKDGLFYRCIDGGLYFAGRNEGAQVFVGTDPAPSQPHMAMLLSVGGQYLNIGSGVVTIPSGISQANGVLIANDGTRTNDSGEICGSVTVTNNQATAWRHLLDFTISPYGFIGFNGDAAGAIAIWSSGTGWVGVPGVTTPTNNYCDFDFTFPACHVDDWTLIYGVGSNAGGACDIAFWQGSTPNAYAISHASGSPATASGTANLDGVTLCRVSLETFGSPAGTNSAFQLKLSGTGSDPFPGAPTY